jgi:hypothetical protein
MIILEVLIPSSVFSEVLLHSWVEMEWGGLHLGTGICQDGPSSLSQFSLEMLSQTHPELCFTNLLGASQSNQVDIQD